MAAGPKPPHTEAMARTERARLGLTALLVVVLAGCATRPLTQPEQLSGGEQIVVASAIAMSVALLVVHGARWMLGRLPREGDASALLLAASALLALGAGALVLMCHQRADDILASTPVGEEPTTIIGLRADCGVTSGDGFLEFHINYDSCSVNDSGLGLGAPLALTGVGLLALGRMSRDGRHATGSSVTTMLGPVPIGIMAWFGLQAVASGPATFFLWAGGFVTVLAVWSKISAWSDARSVPVASP